MKALIIDGYNAIHKIPHLKKILDKNLHEARSGITAMAKEYQRKQGGVDKVFVVFDGRDEYREKGFKAPGHQVFSRTGHGDDKVIRLVSHLASEYHVEVVTDDNFIKNNACVHKATVLGVAKFLGRVNKNQRNKKHDGHAEKSIPENAAAINEELAKHWNI